MKNEKLRIACIGAGYFARFQVEAWARMEQVDLVAICDQDVGKAAKMAEAFGADKVYTDFQEMIDSEHPDVIDVITPPHTHLDLCTSIAKQGIHIICQKPLAPTLGEAIQLVEAMEEAGIRFMVHENFRFQPWFRAIGGLIREGKIGDQLHMINFRMRTGDGWPEDAYLDRQPYFRTMERLLIYETGIHYIDTFRFLFGDIKGVFATFRKLNPVIAGEDFALVQFEFANGALGILDGNRYNESAAEDPRFTFGECLVEGNGGSVHLNHKGHLTLHPLGSSPTNYPYPVEKKYFAGDCVFATQAHFVEAFLTDQPFESEGRYYLNNLRVQEAVYQSAASGVPVDIALF